MAATLQALPLKPVPAQLHVACLVVLLLTHAPPFWQGGLQALDELDDETVVPARNKDTGVFMLRLNWQNPCEAFASAQWSLRNWAGGRKVAEENDLFYISS